MIKNSGKEERRAGKRFGVIAPHISWVEIMVPTKAFPEAVGLLDINKTKKNKILSNMRYSKR